MTSSSRIRHRFELRHGLCSLPNAAQPTRELDVHACGAFPVEAGFDRCAVERDCLTGMTDGMEASYARLEATVRAGV